MTNSANGDLIQRLVDFAEVLDRLNIIVRREAERRTGNQILPNEEVYLLSYVIGNPDSTFGAIAEATGYRVPTLVAGARRLERRGLVQSGPSEIDVATTRLRATEKGVGLRNAARERSAQQMRYALAGLPMEDLTELEHAKSALTSLTAALGFQPLHDSYSS